MDALDFKDKIENAKQEIQDVFLKWAYERIDDFTKGKPILITLGNHLKKRIQNEIIYNSESVDKFINEAAMWVVDEKDGNIGIDSAIDDFISILHNIPEKPFKMGMLNGTFGEGKVSFILPDNILVSAFFGNTNCITLKEDDFMKIKDFLKESMSDYKKSGSVVPV